MVRICSGVSPVPGRNGHHPNLRILLCEAAQVLVIEHAVRTVAGPEYYHDPLLAPQKPLQADLFALHGVQIEVN